MADKLITAQMVYDAIDAGLSSDGYLANCGGGDHFDGGKIIVDGDLDCEAAANFLNEVLWPKEGVPSKTR